MLKVVTVGIIAVSLAAGMIQAQTAPQAGGTAPDSLTDNIAKLSSEDYVVRRQAAEALGFIRDAAAVEPLRRALKDSNPYVRIAVLDSLGLQRAQDALPDIIGVLRGDPEPTVRQSAAVALNFIGDAKAVPDLVAALKDAHDGTRFAAINALGTLRDPAAVAALSGVLTDENTRVRISALDALGRVNNPESLPAIRNSFRDGDAAVRAEAIRVAGMLKDVESESVFQIFLQDADQKIRFAAAGALSRIGSRSGLAVALDGIKHQEPGIRMKSAEILGELGGAEAVAALEKAKADPNTGVQQIVGMALQNIKAKQPKPQPQQIQQQKPQTQKPAVQPAKPADPKKK